MMRIAVGLFCLAAVGMAMIAGCGDDVVTNYAEAPNLVTSPDTIMLFDFDPEGVFFISTDAPGELDWQVTSKPDWLTVTPSSGKIGQTITPIAVAADSAGLYVGNHRGAIEVISTGGEADIEVFFSVALHPHASVSTESIDFGDDTHEASFYLFAAGNGSLAWSAAAADDWCTALPSAGYLSPGDSVLINLTADRQGLPAGNMATTVTIQSNAAEGDLDIPVTMEVLAQAYFIMGDTAVTFGYFQDTAYLWIHNQGNTAGNYELMLEAAYLSLSPGLGSIDAEDSALIEIYIDRAVAPSDTLEIISSLYMVGTGEQADTIAVHVGNYDSPLWQLDFRIVDAEYCRTTGKIAAISADPSQFHLIDPAAQTIESIDLALPPSSVAIRFDGSYAIVGHDALLTYIDAVSVQVEKTLALTVNALDVILPSNGWAYVFPTSDQWSRIKCIELATGLEIDHVGYSIYAGTRARLHPSEDYIYGADNGVSPSDFEKYDIRNDTLHLLYDSPYHGDYSFSGDVWISDDGLRLFARSSNVFRSSEIRENDMVYAGNLAGVNMVVWAEQSSVAERVYVLGGDGGWWDPVETQLHVYGSEYLAYKGKVSLPKYVVPTGEGGDLFDAEGQFVFVDQAGEYLYVLTQAEAESGLLYEWAIATLTVSEGP